LNRANIEKEGVDADSLVAGVLPAPGAAEILRRFVRDVTARKLVVPSPDVTQ
jgi:GMP synthase (glutamine-hydrolysing)